MSSIRAYPLGDEADFYARVYQDARYYLGDNEPVTATREGGFFRLFEQQHQLPRFFTPETGARTALFCHGTGTGKSGTVLLCCMRYSCLPGHPRSLILVPNEFVRHEFENQIWGREWVNSGAAPGKAFSVFMRKFTGDAFITNEMREQLNALDTERAKDAWCKKLWDEHVSQYFVMETHTKFENHVLGQLHQPSPEINQISPEINQTGHSQTGNSQTGNSQTGHSQTGHSQTGHSQTGHSPDISDELVKRYGGCQLVVDEAHYNRKGKRLFQALMHVISVCRAACQPIAGLFLLTATPMIESAEELCPLMNLMLAAEGIDPALHLSPEVIRAYVDQGDYGAEQRLRWCLRGRISYVRGLDPRCFPAR
jgi:hypothetical protein